MFSFGEVRDLAKDHNVIPISKTILADTETAVSVFSKISRDTKNAFLLESVEGGEKLAEFTFIGIDPFLTMTSDLKTVKISGIENRTEEGNPIEILRSMVDKYKPVEIEGAPPFTGGAVGYFGYDTVRLIEDIPLTGVDATQIPDMMFSFYDTIIVFNNRKHSVEIISNIIIQDDTNLTLEYKNAKDKIKKIKNIIKYEKSEPFVGSSYVTDKGSNFTKEEFCDVVEKCKKYIYAGDVFQVVPSQRFHFQTDARPFDVYRMLRIVNPSPYNFFLKFNDISLIGSSPELLVKVKGKEVQTRPLAGTRKRGKDDAEDKLLQKELLDDPKETAEHIMLVDLGRNDLGRVCEYGSVKPTELMNVEKYSHVMHISSTVKGILKDGYDRFDALYACFPAGTLSGAPKIRAMEIIDEVEPTKRGIYGGAIGYIDFSGNLDTCITIRTILMRGDNAYIQSGGGVVADSVPENEYIETVNKAMAMKKALEMTKIRKI